jgi:hypothetical protein
VVRSLWNGIKALPNLFRSARHLGNDVELTVFTAAVMLPHALAQFPHAGLPMPVQEALDLYLDQPVPLPVPTDPETLAVIRELGGADPTVGAWPVPGEPTRVTTRELDALLRPEAIEACQQAVLGHDQTVEGLYLGTAAGSSALNMLDVWSGGAAQAKLEPSADIKILGELLDRNLVIEPDTDRPRVQRWLDAAAAELRPDVTPGLATRDLQAIAGRFHLRLLPRVPP